MTDRAWPHPYAEVTCDGTTVSVALVPGIGDGLRDVARLLSTTRKLGRSNCASIARADEVTIEPQQGRIVVTTKGCPGQSADRLRAEGPIPIARVVRIVAAVIDALRAAHGIGVLHRALSLASVVVDGDDVRVIDFGLGEVLAPDSPHATLRLLALTPERIFGLPAAATEDVYLLGCIAYHLVSGAPPLVDDGDADAAVLRRRHAIEDPPRLSRTGPLGVPRGLGRVIERCLAKEGDDRFADMDALAQAWAEAAAEAGLDKIEEPVPPPTATAKPTVAPSPKPVAPPPKPAAPRVPTGPRPVVPPPPAIASARPERPAPRPLSTAAKTPVRSASAVPLRPRPAAPPPVAVTTAPAVIERPVIERPVIEQPVIEQPVIASPAIEPPAIESVVEVEIADSAAIDTTTPTEAAPIVAPVLAVAPDPIHPIPALAPASRSRRHVLAAAAGIAAILAIAFVATRGESTPEHDTSVRELAANDRSAAPAEATKPATMIAAAPEPVAEPPPPEVPAAPVAEPVPMPIVVEVAPTAAIEPPTDDAEEPIVGVAAAPTVVASDERFADLLRRANESRRAGRTSEGLTLYKQALGLSPRNVEALSAIARIYFDRGAFSDAVAWGKRVVDVEPTSAKARLALGDAYFKLGKLAQAEAQYRKADKLGHRLAESRLAAVRTTP